jgi:hypothetical protein
VRIQAKEYSGIFNLPVEAAEWKGMREAGERLQRKTYPMG